MKSNQFRGILLSALLITSFATALLLIKSAPMSAQAPPPPARAVEVTIIPHKLSGRPSTWLHFTVVVTNWNVAENDNYMLSAKDTRGWKISFPGLVDNRVDNVLPGEEREVVMTVKIPENENTSTHDNIIVTITSLIYEVSDSDLCVAHVDNRVQYAASLWVEPRLVKVDNLYQENASFFVTVLNQGTENDKYLLMFEASPGAMVTLEPNVFDNVQPGEEVETTMLVSSSAPDIRTVSVRVIVFSYGENDNLDDENCIATDENLPYVVELEVSPHKKGGMRCNWVHFEVVVTNWGTKVDNYFIWVSPNGWPSENITFGAPGGPENYQTDNLSPGESIVVDLYVHVPENENLAPVCTDKELWVIVESAHGAVDYDLLIVHVDNLEQCAVDVNIIPRLSGTKPSENAYFLVTVHNVGNVLDNYHIEVILENENWDWGWVWSELTPDNQFENLWPSEENLVGELWVHVPTCVEPSTTNLVTVIATSKTCGVSDNDSAVVHAERAAGVEVTVSPKLLSGPPRRRLTYTVTVTNTGNWVDNFELDLFCPPPWRPRLSEVWLYNIPPHENRTVTLWVYVPTCVQGSTTAVIDVIAWSMFDPSVLDMDNCEARAENFREVYVSIAPSRRSGAPGTTLLYVVTVSNLGNLQENFQLSVDNQWPAVLEDNWIVVPKCSSKTTKLWVTIPSGTPHSTENVVKVTATSKDDPTVTHSATCVVHAFSPAQRRAVKVWIKPSYRSLPAGENDSFTVYVWNRGGSADNFNLTASGPAGWTISLDNTTLTNVGVGIENIATTTLRVTVPSDATVCQRYTITVTAISASDPSASSTGRCIIHVREVA